MPEAKSLSMQEVEVVATPAVEADSWCADFDPYDPVYYCGDYDPYDPAV